MSSIKTQTVSGLSDCFQTPFFRFIKQIAYLFHIISKFDTSSLIIKLKSTCSYFWLIKQEIYTMYNRYTVDALFLQYFGDISAINYTVYHITIKLT